MISTQPLISTKSLAGELPCPPCDQGNKAPSHLTVDKENIENIFF